MVRLPTSGTKLLWAACILLVVTWIAIAITSLSCHAAPSALCTTPISLMLQFRPLLILSSLLLVAIMLAWVVFGLGPTELRRQALLERQYRYALEEVYRGTLQALTSALDARDGETYGHSRRVMSLSLAIGKIMELEPREMQTLAWGALLHDLGKIGIRDEILLKPGPLTPTERANMNEHVIIGQQMALNIPFLARASGMIRHHHERYDGTGYPDCLAGEEIPLLARIFAVADAFDAMTSSRPYRPVPLRLEQAIQILQEGAGSQFCPQVVKAFQSIPMAELEEVRAIGFTPLEDLRSLVWLDADMDSLSPAYYRDVLTGAQNRAAWEARKAAMAMVKGKELGTLLFLDVDGLKQVNDTRGHLTGDRMLADLGTRLIQIRQDVYRLGGDEFLLWFPGGAWNDGAAQALCTTLAHFSEYWAHAFPDIAVSWGASTATADTPSLLHLLDEADTSMYRQKQGRRNDPKS